MNILLKRPTTPPSHRWGAELLLAVLTLLITGGCATAERDQARPPGARQRPPISQRELRFNAAFQAIKKGDEIAFRNLLLQGLGANARDEDGSDLLHAALYERRVEMARMLLVRGARVEYVTPLDGFTPLMEAAEAGSAEAIRLLLAHRARVNHAGPGGLTALICAAWAGDLEEVDILLNAGAKVNARTRSGLSALLCAAGGGFVEVIPIRTNSVKVMRLLLEHKAEVNARDRNERTALSYAIYHSAWGGTMDGVKLLVEHGADVNVQDKVQGETPLLGAAPSENLELVDYLLEHGADVNAKASEGDTPLMRAAADGAVGIVRAILRRKPALEERNSKGQTALDIAKAKQRDDVIALLRAAGARD